MQSGSITYHVHLHHCIGVLPPGVEGNRERESRLAAQPWLSTNTPRHMHALEVMDRSPKMKEADTLE